MFGFCGGINSTLAHAAARDAAAYVASVRKGHVSWHGLALRLKRPALARAAEDSTEGGAIIDRVVVYELSSAGAYVRKRIQIPEATGVPVLVGW